MKHLYILFSFLILTSCHSDRLDIDVSDVDLKLSVSRLDLDFAKVESMKQLEQVHRKYSNEQKEFYNFYLGACLQVGLIEDTFTLDGLYKFVQDPYIKELHAALKKEFPKVELELEALKSGFSFLVHHFKNAPLPKHVIFYNSLFSNSIVSSENTIGVGLERYLGENSSSIKKLPEEPFYPYIKRRMDRKFLVRDMMMSWIGSNVLPEIQDEKELADVMIQWGKHFYVLEACFPYLDKELILRYFPEEYAWASKNEKEFWNYLVAQNSLFKRDYKMALNIFSDGPFTSGLPIAEKAPPRLGQYLGWRIVKNYMEENRDIRLDDLIKIDYKTIIKTYK